MKKIILYNLIFLSINALSQEGSKKCMTTDLIKNELEHNLDYDLTRKSLYDYNKKNQFTNNKNQPVITIPVVIHVIHRAQDAVGANTNIPDAQIEDQFLILNQDYSQTNPEFPNPPRNTFINNVGNPQIQFCLASIDPSGNPTTGITRTPTTNSEWNYDTQSNDMKQTTTGGIDNWDPLRYLNIWICKIGSSGGGQTLGYAYLPGLQAGNQSWKDGIVVDYRFFGTVGNSSNSSDGRTATHEVGHYLGLSHTFCESSGCCDNDLNGNYSWGDVDDTPATEDIYFGAVNANTNNNTCNDLSYSNIFNTDVLDMDENYMSYSNNSWMFSEGQVDVMLGTLNAPSWQGGRVALKNSTVSVNCNGIVASSWDCDSQGNCVDPGTGNGTYSSYNACLSACGCTGNISTITEGFQAPSLQNDWSIDNPDGDQTWAINSSYGYNSSSSISIENSIYSANGEYDDLNSPMMNFTGATSITLDFDYAYSLWTDPSLPQNWSDTLIILVSSDCGLTWEKIWEKAGANLVTTSPIFNGTEWFPTNNNDWDSENINLNNYANKDAIMIKFRNVNQYENNLFLDNINITSNGSLSFDEAQMNMVLVYPNPADKQIDVNYKGLKQIYNMLGERVIHTYDDKIDISNLSKGVYVIKIEDISIRLIKQ
jgi:hypothetical protein